MDKIERRLRRKRGIRKKIHGTKTKPRITVTKSNKHLYAQAIDDDAARTLGASSDIGLKVRRNVEFAVKVGENLAAELLKIGIKEAVFDRNGYPYHGLVKSIAEGLRKGGIKV
ncbi:MAG: 50S ribosomal protein L18 [Spirochaetota bacterium]